MIVHGPDGLDEVSLAGPTRVIEASGGTLKHFDWTPADFGLQPAGLDTMLVTGPAESANMIREILDNRPAPRATSS